MFLSFDRPEDRPNTLWWLFTQILVGYIVLVPSVIFFVLNGLAELIWIPILINAFGDGLAEPVGIRFGSHKYETYVFFQKRNMFVPWRGARVFFLQALLWLWSFILHLPNYNSSLR